MYSSRPRKLRRKELDQNEKLVNVQFLELDSPRPVGEHIHNGFLEKDDGIFISLFATLVFNQFCHGKRSHSWPESYWFLLCTEKVLTLLVLQSLGCVYAYLDSKQSRLFLSLLWWVYNDFRSARRHVSKADKTDIPK